MKKLLPVLLSLLLVFNLTSQALEVNADDYWFQDSGGTWIYDEVGFELASAIEKVTAAGLSLDPHTYVYNDENGYQRFDKAAFQAAYDAALAAAQSEPEPEPEPEPNVSEEVVPNGGDPGESDPASDSSGRYPVGSIVDESGNVWSPDGELLSPGDISAQSPGDAPSDQVSLPDGEDPAEDPQVEDEPAVFTVSDLRSGDDPSLNPLVGLKALIVSIFGEYTPIMTTAAVTETVGNETTTTLIDTVAPGTAGVDYAWIAGVLLFGILLFCLMKLLGGVLK